MKVSEWIVPHGTGCARAAGTLACVVAALISNSAHAADDTYPTKPIRLIVSWAPGGTTDAAARVLTQKLSERMGTPVIVENRPGANGKIGAEVAAKAAPDGYTLFLASAETHSINQHVYQRMPYDPLRDFVGIGGFATNAFAIVTRPGLPIASSKELVAYGKAHPAQLTFASWGIGSTSQLGMEMYKDLTGIGMLHVPFQGEAPALNAIMGGQVDLMMLSAQKAELLGKEGKVKVLVSTSPTRYFAVPNVPTLKEEGLNLIVTNWFGLLAPAKTPQSVLDRLSSEVAATAAQPDVLAQLRGLGLDGFPKMTTNQFARFMADEDVKWGKTIRSANVRLD